MISDLIVITKSRGGNTKKRIILNLKASGISGASSNTERVILPTSSDVAWGLAELLDKLRDGDDITIAVLDFKDAFFQVPVLDSERPSLVTCMRGEFSLSERAAKGSRGAPLLCGRSSALVMRLSASLVSGSSARQAL